MSVVLRGILAAGLAISLFAGTSYAQSGIDIQTLSFESAKPRAAIDASAHAGDHADFAVFSVDPITSAPEKSPARTSVSEPSTPSAASTSCGDACDPACDCCSGWDNIYFYAHREGGWIAGIDFLSMRVGFSESVAYVHRTTTIDPNSGSSTILDQTVDYDFDYEGSARLFFGYNFGDCGNEIRFTWWNFSTDARLTTGLVPANLSEIFAGQLENNAQVAGRFLRTSFSLDVNTFDIEFAKRIPLDNCDPCCPLWDIQWSAGLRFADIQRQHNNEVLNSGSTLPTSVSSGFITSTFSGAGLRTGLEGRRYAGDCNQFSAYMKGNWSLLIGDYDVERRRETPTVNPLAFTIQRDNYIRMIPVMELEAGASWQPSCCCLVSAGYAMSAWWDVGMFEQINGTNFGPEDDSNIMAFDGAFVRVEFTF